MYPDYPERNYPPLGLRSTRVPTTGLPIIGSPAARLPATGLPCAGLPSVRAMPVRHRGYPPHRVMPRSPAMAFRHHRFAER